MKNFFLIILAVIVFADESCKKEAEDKALKSSPALSAGNIGQSYAALDSMVARFGVHKDTITNLTNYGSILVEFKSTFHTAFVTNEDAKFLQGMGTVSLASYSSDNVKQSIGCFPYSVNETINMYVLLQNLTGVNNYVFNVVAVKNLPSGHIKIHDTYLNTTTSLDVTTPYHFVANVTDTLTYKHRFSLIFN